MTAIASVSPFEDALSLEDRSVDGHVQHADAPGDHPAVLGGVAGRRVHQRRRGGRRDLSGQGPALDPGRERDPAASWPSSQGPVSDLHRARGDRVGSRSRGVGAMHRPTAGSRTLDRLARAVTQHRPPRRVPGDERARAGVPASQSSKAGQALGITSGCERSPSSCLGAGTLPNRSRGACPSNSLLTRRCGCRPRRSISHSM
jgi:hypothetical protein